MTDAIPPHPLKGWIPWKPMGSGSALGWLPLDGESFHEPFFEESLSRLIHSSPRRLKTQTTWDLLDRDLEALESLQPALFIFHISRCGSTLLAQMLGMDPANVVLSEPPLMDHLLRAGQDERVVPLLRLLGQQRFPDSRRLILKVDSWHLAFHARLRALFPKVPFVLLYREPARVMASQRKSRGMHAVPAMLEPSLFGFEEGDLPRLEQSSDGWGYLDAYLELVLKRYFQWMETIARLDGNALLVNFEEGPEACYQGTLAFAGLEPSVENRRAALERSAFHGKRPGERHQGSPTEEGGASLQEAYLRLEALRHKGR